MDELGIVLILLVCGAAIAAAAIVVAKLVTKNENKKATAEEPEEAPVSAPAKFHYRSDGRVMSEAQEEFYQKLAEIFSERCYIFPNVAVAALVDAEINGQDAEKALAEIAGQTVDFVMCHADNMKVLSVVVLGDDRRVTILRNAGLPVAVMREPAEMDKQQIVDQIAAAVRKKS